MDEIDKTLLHHLQEDARITNVELARHVKLSPPGLQKRLRKLENAGVISQYTTLVDRKAVGFDLMCFVQVTLRRHEADAIAEFRAFVSTVPEILECYHITGEYDYLLKIIVRDTDHLEKFLVETLTPAAGMDKIRTSLALSEIKKTTAVPVLPNGPTIIE
ncbi:MAG TPA: Lrp/AsnC family transcriptional regulator [Anaerolineae bacterium]|nr:Lrp/AsnC family transcriptional regulator [Anaerolineae bacterium]